MGRAHHVNPEELDAACARLGDAVVDPALWPNVLEEICAALKSTGAGLLQSDVRTTDIPRTPSTDEVFDAYFKGGFHVADQRAARGVPLLLGGKPVVTEQELFSREEVARDPLHQECLRPHGFQWFAAVGFWAGSALWGLSIQRTIREGPFEIADERALAPLSRRLTETATLSTAVGRAVLSGIGNALTLVKQPALMLDRMGLVRDANAAANTLFDGHIRLRERRLVVRDRLAQARLTAFLDQLRTTPDTAALSVEPIVVRRADKRPVIIRVLPIDGAARSPFLGARALLLLTDLERQTRTNAQVMQAAFGLTPAETRLAVHLATGLSPETAADEMGVAVQTVRTHLKSIFSKTDTHRQGELVALLARLGSV